MLNVYVWITCPQIVHRYKSSVNTGLEQVKKATIALFFSYLALSATIVYI